MSSPTATAAKARPVNLNPVELGLKLPLAGIVSLLHRVSGILLFIAIPLVIFLLDISLRNEIAFGEALRFLNQPVVKVLAIFLLWGLCHHVVAGLRFLILDLHIGVHKPYPRLTAIATLIVSGIATILLGVKIW